MNNFRSSIAGKVVKVYAIKRLVCDIEPSNNSTAYRSPYHNDILHNNNYIKIIDNESII